MLFDVPKIDIQVKCNNNLQQAKVIFMEMKNCCIILRCIQNVKSKFNSMSIRNMYKTYLSQLRHRKYEKSHN